MQGTQANYTETSTVSEKKPNTLDLITLNLSQPRTAGWYIADKLVTGIACGVGVVAVNAAVNKFKERRQAKLELISGYKKVQ